jgi:AraC-like DNA-binding protein
MPTLVSFPDHPDVRQRLFRALHEAEPTTRRALVLSARGWSLQRVAQQLGCHPRILQRHLERFAASLNQEGE